LQHVPASSAAVKSCDQKCDQTLPKHAQV
jgi:hypothetical protein